MASKQLGKLRQWAGEVISSREKTVVSEEFVELEQDIELRKLGAERLLLASSLYHHALQKKKECIALPEPEKLLPIDSLGIVMITHGEEFGPQSNFGTSLVNYGRAHCKIATLQEAYAVTFRDTFLASIEKFQEDIKEYEATKKKLESRRLAYDAAISKQEKVKSSKKEKEKERLEAEDELELAKARYEETTEDLRAQIHAIQENEIDQLRELTAFLDLEMNFVEQYLEVLKETKSEWAVTGLVRSTARGREPSAHALHRKSPAPKSRTLSTSVPFTTALDPSDDDEEDHLKSSKRRASTHTRSSSVASRPPVPSRPSSRSSRKSISVPNDPDEKSKEDKIDKDKVSKRMNVSGWASNAMGSLSGRGKKAKDKDTFTTLDDDENPSQRSSEEEQNGYVTPGHKSQRSLTSLPGSLRRKSSRGKSKERGSPHILPRILKPPSMQEKKAVRALYDFSGSADELSFRVGDEIVVVNEVLEGWWMGELRGKQGLFPTSYTEPAPPKPPIPARPDTLGLLKSKSEPASASRDSLSSNGYNDDYGPSDDEVFGSQPLSPNHSPFFGGAMSHRPDTESIASVDRGHDYDNRTNLVAEISRHHDQQSTSSSSSLANSTSSFTPIRPSAIRRLSAAEVSNTPIPSGKKAPPPPPPRRSTTAIGNTASPPIPARRLSGFSGSAPLLIPPPNNHNVYGNTNTTPGSSVSSHSPSMMYDTSPFESSSELNGNGTGDRGGDAGGSNSGCTDFKQNPFKPKGFCNNCFQFH
ncbi:hypothetical protein D9758_016777 [Tetrapyrgos nigripes]|uniref:BAR-domain-containing protein n=1 Tax=Tetrapyrgos nigripes TaxID=182062 RepID=A0A8H5BRW8_9AGAR|nr:hypothetical protein D9758_016777 [Tetrapyrgos nigripes]